MSNKKAPVKFKKPSKLKYTIMAICSVLVFLGIWEAAVQLGWISTDKLPAPSAVISSFFVKLTDTKPDDSTIITHTLVSLTEAITGLLAAIAIGTPLGLLMGWYKGIDRFISPIFELVRPIPPIAWIPLMIVWVGVGLAAKTIIIFTAAFVPCVINSYTGIRSTSAVHINVAKTFGASNFQMFRKVGVPSAMPMAFAGMRVALSSAWGTLVAAELLASNAGLGYMITMGRQLVRTDLIVLGMVIIGILGFIFTAVFGKVENIVVKWRTV